MQNPKSRQKQPEAKACGGCAHELLIGLPVTVVDLGWPLTTEASKVMKLTARAVRTIAVALHKGGYELREQGAQTALSRDE